MTTHTAGREAMWSRENPWLQIAYDATSLTAAMECPRKYFLGIIEGWRPAKLSVDLMFGKIYGDATAVYAQARAEGSTHDTSTIAALRYALVQSLGGRDEVSGAVYANLDELDIRGTKTRYCLARAVVWWAEAFGREDSLKTIILPGQKAAMEVSWRLPLNLVAPSGETYLACGHFDRAAEDASGVATYIVEKKTTGHYLNAQYWDGFLPNTQILQYHWAGRVHSEKMAGVVVEACQVMVSGVRIERKLINLSAIQADEWEENVVTWITQLEHWAVLAQSLSVAGLDPALAYPQATSNCMLHGGCNFRAVCSQPRHMRMQFLEGNFVRQPWNPLRVR